MLCMNPSGCSVSKPEAQRSAFRFFLLPIIKVVAIVFLLCFGEHVQAQILYYQDSFFGGITAGGYAPIYNGAGTGTIQLRIPANATIRKATLFAGDFHSLTPLTVTLNGQPFTFNASNVVTPTFFSIYGNPATVHAIDVLKSITPSQQAQTLTVPGQVSTNGRYTDFYLLIAYELPTTFKTRVSVFLNAASFAGKMNFTVPISFHAPGKKDLGLAIYGGYICNDADAEEVRCNNTYLGKIFGPEPNSGDCGGPFANFYYDNTFLHGLGSDKEDAPMGQADALSNIRSLVQPQDNFLQLEFDSYFNPNNKSNSIWGVVLVDGDIECEGFLLAKPTAMNFISTTICSAKDSLKGFYTNTGCDTLVIDQALLVAGSEFNSSGLRTGILVPGDTIYYTIYLNPQTVGGKNGSLQITEHSLHDPASTLTTNIPLSGLVGYGVGVLAANSAALNFPRMTICSSQDSLRGFFINIGCDDLVIDEALLQTGADYSAIGLVKRQLAPGDTMFFTVYLTPLTKGTKNGSVKIVAHSLHSPSVLITKIIPLSGTVGDGTGVLSAEPPSLIFTSKTICSLGDSLTGLITNTGCDTLIIDNVSLVAATDYSATGLRSGFLAPSDTLRFTIYLKPKTKGAKNGNIRITAHSINNPVDSSSKVLSIDGFVGDGRGILSVAPPSFGFAPMTICSSEDSLAGFITNNGCDTLIIDNASLLSVQDYSSRGLRAGFLAPGDTTHFIIYLTPLTKGAKNGSVLIAAHSINNLSDSTVIALPLNGTVGNGTAIITPLSDSLNFGSRSFCVSRDSLVIFINSGCDTLRIDSTTISGLGFGAGTMMLPLLIPPGDTGKIPIVTFLDTIGRKLFSSGSISIWGNDANRSKQVQLICKYNYPLVHHIYLAPALITGSAGAIIEFELHTDEDIGSVKTIDVDLSENNDLLEYKDYLGNNSLTFAGGHLHITGAPFISVTNGMIAKLRFNVYLTNDSTDFLTLSNVQLNLADSDFSPCRDILEENGSVFTYTMLCGDFTLGNYLRGKLPFDNVSVHPNPAMAELILELDSKQEQDISVIISNSLGEKSIRRTFHINKGKLQTTLDVRTLSSGTYTIEVEGVGKKSAAHFIKYK